MLSPWPNAFCAAVRSPEAFGPSGFQITPVASPLSSMPVGAPKPNRRNASYSRAPPSARPIFAAPTLFDSASTSAGVIGPCPYGWSTRSALWMWTRPMVRLLSSTNVSVVVIAPASSAAAMVNGFITEPGSYCRETAGLLNSWPSVVANWFASYDG